MNAGMRGITEYTKIPLLLQGTAVAVRPRRETSTYFFLLKR